MGEWEERSNHWEAGVNLLWGLRVVCSQRVRTVRKDSQGQVQHSWRSLRQRGRDRSDYVAKADRFQVAGHTSANCRQALKILRGLGLIGITARAWCMRAAVVVQVRLTDAVMRLRGMIFENG